MILAQNPLRRMTLTHESHQPRPTDSPETQFSPIILCAVEHFVSSAVFGLLCEALVAETQQNSSILLADQQVQQEQG